MDRGSRLINLFQSLEKLNGQRMSSGHKLSSEEMQHLRYSTSKIQNYVSAQDKIHRDLIIKSSAYLDILLSTLETCGDACSENHIVCIINELLGRSHTGKRASVLVAHGTTHVLFHVLVSQARDESTPQEFLILIHQVLSKLGPKDRKFAVKARLSQALSVTLSLIKTNTTNPKILQPVLHCLKLYAANAVNASYLGKNGAVSVLFKLLTVCGRKYLSLLRYALDTLALLVKTKSNSARAIGQGGVPVLLNMFLDWHRCDSKNRHIQLRKAILNVVKHLTNLKSGRKALMEGDGIRILYTVSQEAVDIRELESLIVMASIIMRKCFPKNRLPLATLRSPVTCSLPESDFHVVDAGEGNDMGIETETTHIESLPVAPTADDNEYESSVDNDDDMSSDDDPDANKMESELDKSKSDKIPEDGDADSSQRANRRSLEDLQMYKRFFPELYDFDALLNDELPLPMPEEDDRAIIIPTATFDPLLRGRNAGLGRTSQSASSIQNNNNNKTKMSNRHSVPSLMSDELAAALQELRMSTNPGSDLQMLAELQISEANKSGVRLPRMFGRTSSTSAGNQPVLPTAVNLKTGSSIFALDVTPTKVTRNSLMPKTKRKSSSNLQKVSNCPSTASSSNGKCSAPSGSRKSSAKSRSSCKSEEWLSSAAESNPLAISAMITPRDKSDKSDMDYSASDTDTDGYLPAHDSDDVDYSNTFESPEIYTEIAAQTKSVGRFNKLAYPDLHGHIPPPYKEPLHEKQYGIQRAKIFEDIDRFINPENVIDKVVYDMDTTVSTAGPTFTSRYSNLTNHDEIRIQTKEDTADHLKFNSQFECGNLRKAIQVRKYEYDLILNPDVNTNHHHQWFYFEISNIESNIKYRFNIVNCEKLNSQFNYGMRPAMFSVTEATKGRPYWTRVGSEICYYKNHFLRSSQTTGGVRGKSYYTTTFSIVFKHKNDVCYLAYHYPYTYSMMKAHLYKWENTYDSNLIYYKHQTLCETVTGNTVPVLTITSHPHNYDRDGIEALKNRPYIFLSSRVHPGESNSSWVMRGTINFLLSNKLAAQQLRDAYIFKIVPMLNPDGVINGNHRCSVVAEDLNRRWMNPCPKLHPTIYHSKGLLQYLYGVGKPPLVFCDYHGHSRRKNVFLYGCSPTLSWMAEDLDNPCITGNKNEDTGFKALPRALHNIAPSFSLSNCSFMVEKSKESTARVVVWRQIRVVRSYTMESSYCGCDQGPYRGLHLCTRELEEMGRKFCEGLLKVSARHHRRSSSSGSLSGLIGATASSSDLLPSGGRSGSSVGSRSDGGSDELRLRSDSASGSESEGGGRAIDKEEAGIK